MKNVLLVGMVVILAGLSIVAFAQEKKAEQPPMNAEMQAMMEAYAKVATVGKEHDFIAKMAGTWVAVVKFWMGPEPTISYGVSENRVVLGGRFIFQKVSSVTMGQAFEGIGIYGYDNAQQKIVGMWIDSMGTGIMTSEGKLDLVKKAMNTESKHFCPIAKQMKSSRDEMVFVDDDTIVSKMFEKDEKGKENMTMEITYYRVPIKEELGD